MLIQRTSPRCLRRLSSWRHAEAPACVVSISTGGSYFFSLHGCVCVRISAQMSETQVLSAISLSSSFSSSCSSHTHKHSPPLTSMTAASSTGRPVGGATHVLTSPWQPLSSPCPSRHTHSRVTRPHPPHQPQDTHTNIHTEFLGLHPVQDKLNPHALPAIFEKSIHGSSLFQITLDEVRYSNIAVFFLNQVVIIHAILAQLCNWWKKHRRCTR